MSCCKCESDEVIVYCLDCEDVYCQACTERIHQECDADHSIEPIVYCEKKGVRILTLVFDEVLLCIIGYLICTRTRIEETYFQVNTMCPFVTQCRRAIAFMDAGASALLQSSTFEACSIEHSFWRFYTDTWVRSIVTSTDSVLVLLANAFHVVFSDVVLVTVMIPVLSLMYALLFWILHSIEASLPKMPSLLWLERWARIINIVDFVEYSPPVTLPRTRESTDLWDWLTYTVLRITRVPRYYYGRISDGLEALLLWSVVAVLTVRLSCIIFGTPALIVVAILAMAGIFVRFPNAWKFFLVTLGVLVSVGLVMYDKHKALFAHVKQGKTFTEKVFWQVLLDILKLDKSGFDRVLLTLCATFLTLVMGLPILCKRRFKKQ